MMSDFAKGFVAAQEMAAQIIETTTPQQSNEADSYLGPRRKDNIAGLEWAVAIREMEMPSDEQG